MALCTVEGQANMACRKCRDFAQVVLAFAVLDEPSSPKPPSPMYIGTGQ